MGTVDTGVATSRSRSYSLGISDEAKERLEKAQNHVRAFWWTIFAALSFATMSVIVKDLSAEFHSHQLIFFRSFFNLLMVTIICKTLGKATFGSGDRILIFRGLIGFTGLSLYYMSMARIPLSLAAIVINLSPIFTIIASRVLLRERLQRRTIGWIAAAMASMTMIMITRGSGIGSEGEEVNRMIAGVDSSVFWWGIGFGLLGSAVSAVAHVTVRAATAQFDSFTIVFYFALISTLCSLPFAVAVFEPMTWIQFGLMFITGITSTCGQFGAAQAFRYGTTGVVSTIGLCGPLFAILAGVFILGEAFGWVQWVGVALFMLSLAMTARNRSKPPQERMAVEHPGRR